MRNYSNRHALTQVRQKHSHQGKQSKAGRSLQNALAVRNAKSVQGGRSSRQEEEDDEDHATVSKMERAMTSVFDELGFKSAFHALQQLENEQDADDMQEPDMDIHETDFSYVVQAVLPGVN
ncbi:hypothetical protein HDU81_010734 [Chytriomyces hyalinus]|nr:hypothetical protein HDU81_010734 [Chytriomyces hyalinus]